MPFVSVGLSCCADSGRRAARSGLWSPLLFPSLAKIGNELLLFVSQPESLLEAWVSL